MPRDLVGIMTSTCCFSFWRCKLMVRFSAKILNIKGRQHSVKIYYTAQSQEDFCEAALKTFFQIHTTTPPGDVLIFLPGEYVTYSFSNNFLISGGFFLGQDDIESLEQSIKTYAKDLPLDKMQVWYLFILQNLVAKTNGLSIGIRMPYVRLPCFPFAGKGFCSYPCKPSEVHSSHKYRRNFHYDTWHQICYWYRLLQRKVIYCTRSW